MQMYNKKPQIILKGDISEREIEYYTNELISKHPDQYITEITIEEDGEFVNCSYKYDNPSFERIRRITGYLVGTLDRFNNAKKAEVADRVKHNA